jgi:acyl-CoA thioester hydrolase
MQRITIPVRVRYVECDPMGFVHHSVYPVWFELARTELLRESGVAYAELEKSGTLIVVVKLEVNYKKPARYDDLLDVTAMVTKVGGVRIEHDYEIRRGAELLCTGNTTLACLDREGRLTGVPQALADNQPLERK